MAKSKKEVNIIALKVSAERKKMIQDAAKGLGLTVSGLMNVAVNEYIKSNVNIELSK